MLDALFDMVLCSLDDPDMRQLLDSVGGTRVILYSSKLSSEEGALLTLQLNGAASDHVFGVTSAKHPLIVYRPIVDMGGGYYIEDCVGRVKLYTETLQRLDNIEIESNGEFTDHQLRLFRIYAPRQSQDYPGRVRVQVARMTGGRSAATTVRLLARASDGTMTASVVMKLLPLG